MNRSQRKFVMLSFLWLCSVLCMSLSHAQEPNKPLALKAPTGEGQMLVMAVGEKSFGETLIEDVRLSVDLEDGLQVFKAYHRGRMHTAHVALDGPIRGTLRLTPNNVGSVKYCQACGLNLMTTGNSRRLFKPLAVPVARFTHSLASPM